MTFRDSLHPKELAAIDNGVVYEEAYWLRYIIGWIEDAEQ